MEIPKPPENQGFVFIHVPKTGGRSVRWALGKSRGASATAVDHADAIEQSERMGRSRWDALLTFAVARDPYERAVSLFSWMRERHSVPNPTLEAVETALGVVVMGEQMVDVDNIEGITEAERFRCWVHGGFPVVDHMFFRINAARRGHWIHEPQAEWITGRDGELLVSRLLRLERLEEGWADVAALLGASPQIGHLNASTHGKPTDYYDESTRAIVAKRYARDFELLGYEV